MLRSGIYKIRRRGRLLKGGYLVEVDDKEGKNVIWEVVDNHVVEKGG